MLTTINLGYSQLLNSWEISFDTSRLKIAASSLYNKIRYKGKIVSAGY
jgi:hypothetical protein